MLENLTFTDYLIAIIPAIILWWPIAYFWCKSESRESVDLDVLIRFLKI